MTAEEAEAQAALAVSRGDALGAAIWRARASCIRNGRILPDGRGWATQWEANDATRQRDLT